MSRPYYIKGNKSKYHSTKVEFEGITFDSRRELKRWRDLKAKEDAGEIFDLQRQVKFVLIPAIHEPDIIGPRGGRKPGKLIERECSYYADFVYKDAQGRQIVEDTKGMRTADYIIKRKLLLYIHGIQIHEI